MPKSANALFVEGSNLTKIQLTIENETVELSHGDFIEFKRKGLSDIKTQRAKILYFGWRNGESYANRIFFLPWREEERAWGNYVVPIRGIPLEHDYFHNANLADQSQRLLSHCDEPYGDWTTIRKLDESPEHQ